MHSACVGARAKAALPASMIAAAITARRHSIRAAQWHAAGAPCVPREGPHTAAAASHRCLCFWPLSGSPLARRRSSRSSHCQARPSSSSRSSSQGSRGSTPRWAPRNPSRWTQQSCSLARTTTSRTRQCRPSPPGEGICRAGVVHARSVRPATHVHVRAPAGARTWWRARAPSTPTGCSSCQRSTGWATWQVLGAGRRPHAPRPCASKHARSPPRGALVRAGGVRSYCWKDRQSVCRPFTEVGAMSAARCGACAASAGLRVPTHHAHAHASLICIRLHAHTHTHTPAHAHTRTHARRPPSAPLSWASSCASPWQWSATALTPSPSRPTLTRAVEMTGASARGATASCLTRARSGCACVRGKVCLTYARCTAAW